MSLPKKLQPLNTNEPYCPTTFPARKGPFEQAFNCDDCDNPYGVKPSQDIPPEQPKREETVKFPEYRDLDFRKLTDEQLKVLFYPRAFDHEILGKWDQRYGKYSLTENERQQMLNELAVRMGEVPHHEHHHHAPHTSALKPPAQPSFVQRVSRLFMGSDLPQVSVPDAKSKEQISSTDKRGSILKQGGSQSIKNNPNQSTSPLLKPQLVNNERVQASRGQNSSVGTVQFKPTDGDSGNYDSQNLRSGIQGTTMNPSRNTLRGTYSNDRNFMGKEHPKGGQLQSESDGYETCNIY